MSRASACVFVIIVALTCYSCAEEKEDDTERTGRQLDIPRDMRIVRFFVDQHQHLRRPPQISPRSDHFPQRIGPGPGPGPYGRPPFGRPPPQPPMPHLRRRVHTGPPGPPPPGMFLRPNGPPPQFNNYHAFKNSRFPLSKGPYPQKISSINFPYPGQPQIAPNQNTIPQGQSFKPSPVYNGEVIVRPSASPLISSPPSGQPPQQNLFHSSADNKQDSFRQYKPAASQTHHMYSVYEDTDSDMDSDAYRAANIGESAMKEAKQYLNFMSSNEYFLPKIEPDYRKMDQAKQLHQQQLESALNAQQQQRYSESANLNNAAFTVNAPLQVAASSSTSSSSTPQLPPLSHKISPTSTYSSRHPAQSNLGSYQTDNNVFVVNSDGMKNVHHVVPSASYPDINHQQHSTHMSMASFTNNLRPVKKDHKVPDPERVEFTERDAIHVSYTSNPMDSMYRHNEKQQQHHAQKKHATSERHYIKATLSHGTGSNSNHDDDGDEDEEMIQAASINDAYGRVKGNPNEVVAHKPSVEQKDTEDYCERICSNVQDEDEEVVCGSDGFIYTSEAQMECYASCLHIDVTIQSKGTCNQTL